MPVMPDSVMEAVLHANRSLSATGLATHTWGNVSGVDRDGASMAIKPSGVPYEELSLESLVVLSLSGEPISGSLMPSSDAPTHLVLYDAFPGVGGIVHTHSLWATIWAQAGRPIPPLGTTHADHFHGEIPCTRELTPDEVAGPYEEMTGRVIVEAFEGRDPLAVPAVLVRGHGPFAWGRHVEDAFQNALVLELVAELALRTLSLAPDAAPISADLLDRHFMRKHGPDAYYGQR